MDRERRVRMPFTEVIETAEVAPGLLEEPIHGFLMRGRITPEFGVRSRIEIERKIDDAEMSRRKLFSEHYTADLARSCCAEGFAQARRDVRCKFNPHLLSYSAAKPSIPPQCLPVLPKWGAATRPSAEKSIGRVSNGSSNTQSVARPIT